jgi:flagellar motor switch protein FliM
MSDSRNLTEIELNIIEGVIKLAMRDLCGAWHPIIELELYLEGKGTKAQMFQIVSPAETVIAVSLDLKIADTNGTMNLCIPARILKMLRAKFDQQWNSRRQKAEGGDAQRLYDLIKPASIPLSSEIQRSKLTVDDLLKVSVGDVIELNDRINDPVFLCVGGIAKFVGRIVQRRGKRAFEVTERYVS